MIEERDKTIDEAVAEGSITREDGEIIKERSNNNFAFCHGNYGQKSQFRRSGNFRFNN